LFPLGGLATLSQPMRIEAIRLKNFRAFKEVELRDLPNFGVFVGANGTGKSTLFSVFQFLRDAMSSNVTAALGKLGGSRGFQEVRSRGCTGPIEIELKIRADLGRSKLSLITYMLHIDEDQGRPVVDREILKYRRGSGGQPWHFIDFSRGQGDAVTNEMESVRDEKELRREQQTLKSPDILAIKGLAQFERFPAAVALGTLIENWHLSDFHISRARPEQEVGYAEHLTREGENLSLVIEYLQKQHPKVFEEVLRRLAKRIPGIERVDSKVTEEGRVLLRFRDGSFEDPFLARYVSDGTIKMLAYLVLLLDPKPHPLLCIEEPENQLYPSLLSELAEEFRSYSVRGGQVLVSTHSPDFLNAIELDEVFWLIKQQGYTEIHRGRDNAQIKAYMADGDKLGYLWKQGLFDGVDPQ
jgi:predicted ATPase